MELLGAKFDWVPGNWWYLTGQALSAYAGGAGGYSEGLWGAGFLSPNIAGANLFFEALIGAIYLDRGYIYCKKFIYEKVIIPYVDISKLEGKITSYKGLIIEWCQKQKKSYDIETYEDTGNETVKHYSVKISIDGVHVAKGRARSKKKAEEQASKRVYFTFQKQIDNQ